MATAEPKSTMAGGIKTKWLFVDMLEEEHSYIGEVAGSGEHQCRDGKTQMPYVVWVGAVKDGIPTEYQISVWRIESKEPFDMSQPGKFEVSRRGDYFFFEPA